MLSRRSVIAIGSVLAAAGVVSGCASTSSAARSTRGSTGAEQRVEGDRASQYVALDALAHDSKAVVIAEAGAQQATRVHGVPFMTTQMRVLKTVAGSTPATFRLYQLGANDGSVDPEMVVAATGSTYLLFVVPYETSPGVVTSPDLFTTVGAAAGMYGRTASDTFAKSDPASPQLPQKVSAESAGAAYRTTHG